MECYLQLTKQGGAGRTYIVMFEQNSPYTAIAADMFSRLEHGAKVFLVECSEVGESTWRTLYEKFSTVLTEHKIRQASVVAFGGSTTLSQLGYLYNPKLIRSMFLIDGSARPHPSRWDRLVDWLEEHVPLGLPMRGEGKNFNGRSHLQRIRCPVLCATTSFANDFLKEQAQHFVGMMPTAWWCDLPTQYPNQDQAKVLTGLVDAFQEIPAKCPQH